MSRSKTVCREHLMKSKAHFNAQLGESQHSAYAVKTCLVYKQVLGIAWECLPTCTWRYAWLGTAGAPRRCPSWLFLLQISTFNSSPTRINTAHGATCGAGDNSPPVQAAGHSTTEKHSSSTELQKNDSIWNLTYFYCIYTRAKIWKV